MWVQYYDSSVTVTCRDPASDKRETATVTRKTLQCPASDWLTWTNAAVSLAGFIIGRNQ